jgi:hypothetical protein
MLRICGLPPARTSSRLLETFALTVVAPYQSPVLAIPRPLDEGSGLGIGRDGHSHAGDSDRELRALPRGRVRRKPLHPLFIHSGEVCFLKKNDSGADDPFEGSACRFEDRRYILQTLSGLFLDRIPKDLPAYWIVWPSA